MAMKNCRHNITVFGFCFFCDEFIKKEKTIKPKKKKYEKRKKTN